MVISVYGFLAKKKKSVWFGFQVNLRSAQRILRLCEANKGFYIKAGQFVAAMGHAPREYVSTLSTLQDKVICPSS